MTIQEISKRRLQHQLITNPELQSPKEVVSWMGAIQAQDYKMAKWAIASRLKGATHLQIEEAISEGDIIRTHVMRPTWHFVSSDDIYWMLELTAPRIKRSLKLRHRQLEITVTMLKKSHALLEKMLSGGHQLSQDELYIAFEQAKIPIDNNRGYHLLLWAELEGLICSGATKNKKITYALLEERVTRKETISEEEALSRLAKKYFSSHGPATIQDFSWWSGLTMGKARQGLNAIQSDFVSRTFEDKTFWFSEANLIAGERVQLLAAYDEFLIGYKDKSISLPFEAHRKKVHHIGTFRPFIVIDGLISGTWKLASKKKTIDIQIELFQAKNEKHRKAIAEEIKALENFHAPSISGHA